MKKVLVLMFLISNLSYAQIKLKTYSKEVKGGYEFLADNDEYCPVSLLLNLELSNMSSSEGNNKIFVIPARTKGYVLTQLKNIKKGRYGYRSKTNFHYGDHLNATHDTTYVYDLPFKKGKKFKISQGYFGERSHQGKRALDFSMPIGTDVYAAREGVVIKVVDHNVKTCYKKECAKYNNKILIYHKDGTFSTYAHIDTNTAKVKVGDVVEKGQLIAKSGNIGFSSGPHLHFMVFNQKMKTRESLETKFKIYEDGKPVFLKNQGVYNLDED